MTINTATTIELTPWQARQAAMLYQYASLDHLKGLHHAVTQLIDGVVGPMLDLAEAQGRDAILTDPRWGTRDTAENWANNAWPYLKDLQASLAKTIAMRAFDKFNVTWVSSNLRGVEQSSTQWMSPEEEERYEAVAQLISFYADPIDKTVDPSPKPHWDDFDFAYYFASFAAGSPRIPRFRMRPDLAAATGQAPPRTGVYLCADDPHAALQFAATGPGGIRLRDAATFNAIGLEALAAVGRESLWFDNAKMYAFATASKHVALFGTLAIGGKPAPRLAPSGVAGAAFTTRPGTWHFVEIVPDQFEDVRIVWTDSAPGADTRRLPAGAPCREPGFYFSPAKPGSRAFFQSGQLMPDFGSGYGQTVWQWDPDQTPR
jgi:hypothetical protein